MMRDAFRDSLRARLRDTDNVSVEGDDPTLHIVEVRISRTYAMLMPVSTDLLDDPAAYATMVDLIVGRFEYAFRAACGIEQ